MKIFKKSLLILGTCSFLSLSTNLVNANPTFVPDETIQAINEFNKETNFDIALTEYRNQSNSFVVNDMFNNIDLLKAEIEYQIKIAKDNNQIDKVVTLESYLKSLNNNNTFVIEYMNLSNSSFNDYEIANQIQDSINNILTNVKIDNKNNESNENNWTDDWSETISAVKNGQDEQRGNPDWYMFTGENYIVRTDDTASEIGDTDASDQGYDFTIDPGEYRIVSGWEKVALEIRSSSGKDETVKFDEADHEEKIELHAGDEVSVVSLDGQDNYLAMYQIQQYDE